MIVVNGADLLAAFAVTAAVAVGWWYASWRSRVEDRKARRLVERNLRSMFGGPR